MNEPKPVKFMMDGTEYETNGIADWITWDDDEDERNMPTYNAFGSYTHTLTKQEIMSMDYDTQVEMIHYIKAMIQYNDYKKRQAEFDEKTKVAAFDKMFKEF